MVTKHLFVVSHDQNFVESICDQIIDIDQNGDNEIIFGDNSGMFYFLNQEDMSIYASFI